MVVDFLGTGDAPRVGDRVLEDLVVDFPSSVVVVVPARNEERRLDGCLRAVAAAADRLRTLNEAVPVRVVLVLDRCTDRTAEVAARWPAIDVVVTEHGRVGAARAAGAAGDSMWIANTDADSVAPVDWLQTQLHHARSGADLVLGMVHPDPAEVPDRLLLAWRDRHVFADGHRHVHGANLGVGGAAYFAAGGFPDVAVDEDVALVDTVRRCGGRVVSTSSSPVATSARLFGRTPGGMAGYLRDLCGPAHIDPLLRAADGVALN